MAKEDVGPAPEHPPAKRRQLEAVPALWLAVWHEDKLERLTPSEKRRVEEERARRRALKPSLALGLLVGPEGVTPNQFAGISDTLEALKPTAIHHPGVHSRLHQLCKRQGVPVHAHDGEGLKAVVRASERALAAPRSPEPGNPVMEAVRYAKHRTVPVIIVLPGGQQQ